jgi:phosphoglycolate phosphatase
MNVMTPELNQETINDTAKLIMHRLVARMLARDHSLIARAKVSLAKQADRFPNRTFIQEWEQLLALPVDDIRRLLTSRNEEMTRLRLSSPFKLAEGVDFTDTAFRRRIWRAARRIAVRGAEYTDTSNPWSRFSAGRPEPKAEHSTKETALVPMDAIYFDLDGTLTDPKVGITRSIQYALARLDQAAPPADELTWCIGPPLRASFLSMLGSDDLADRAVTFYRERFGDIGIYETSVYPGITDILSSLQGSGRRLFVATSKPVVYASRIVEHFDMSGHFEQVFGSELDGTRADKTELLDYALKTSGADRQRATMVGDRRHDMLGARNNGVTAIGVLYGYGSEHELVEAGAHQVCASPLDVLKSVNRSAQGQVTPPALSG